MRLLLIGPEARDRETLRNFSGVWSHYLTREFEKAGVGVRFDAPMNRTAVRQSELVDYYRNLPLDGIDHVLALGTRYFEKVPVDCAGVLRSRLNGAVTQLHDGKSRASVDVTFTVKRVEERRHHCIGWAADPALLQPKQDVDHLCILVDHPHYVTLRGDKTSSILADCQRFIQSRVWARWYKSARVRRIADGGVVDGFGTVQRYMRQSVPFPVICDEYSRAHLFMVTHKESIGLSVLETAMAGALPVVPNGFVPRDRLSTVRHIEYADRVINWRGILSAINPRASREQALENTWDRVASRILTWLVAFRK